MLQHRGAYGEADDLLRTSQRLYAAQLGPDHLAVLTIQVNRAALLYERGDLAASEVLFRRSLASQRRVLRPGNPRLGRSLALFAEVRLDQGAAGEAEAIAGEAAETLEAAFGPDHWMARDARFVRARAQAAQARYAEAEATFLARLAVQRAAGSAGTAETLGRIVELYEAWNRPEQAKTYRAEQERIAAPATETPP